MSVKDEQLLAWISEEFYCKGISQVDLAKKLRTSKATVSRLIQKAVAEGIVRFEITVPRQNNVQLEKELEEVFGISRAVVINTNLLDEQDKMDHVGRIGAEFLPTFLNDGDIVGLSGGRSVNSLVKHLAQEDCTKQIEITQLSGVYSEQAPQNSSLYAAEHMARKFGSKWHPLLLPAVMGSVHSRDVLINDPAFKKSFGIFEKINVAVLGVGSLLGDVPDSDLYRTGYLEEDELQKLKKQGAVGVILSNFIDADGNPVPSSLKERIISMSLDQLKAVPFSIGVANGPGKVLPVRAALKGGYYKSIITDSETAASLLENK